MYYEDKRDKKERERHAHYVTILHDRIETKGIYARKSSQQIEGQINVIKEEESAVP